MLVILINFALACSPQEVFKIKCQDYCWIDQGLPAFIRDNKCYCGNEVDLSKQLNKVPNLISPRSEVKKKYYWE
jgi:hypothetical protein